jgi:hypothetical protein
MRYICIPPPVDMVDILTDQPTGEPSFSFAKTGSVIAACIVQKQALDLLDAVDLRAKLRRPVGEWVELTEAEFKALEPEAKKPTGLSPNALLCLAPHFRAILSALDKKPAVLAEADNGVAAQPS